MGSLSKRCILTIIAVSLALVAGAQTRADDTPEVLEIVDMGSFHVGGRTARVSGRPVREVTFTPGGVPAKIDPNGDYMVEQMYVQYFVPKNKRSALPILMWHGGGLTGVTYETTPDGREGWVNYFLRKGWTVYNSDAVERGRSGWASRDVWEAEPIFLPIANPFERFRIGQGPGSWNSDPTRRKILPGNQFPVEAYLNFTKQVVPRWTTTDGPILSAYTALVDRVCPCVLLVHSQSGQFGQKVAQARPDKIKALVLVEPAGLGDPAHADALRDTPIAVVYGDFIEQDARWPATRRSEIEFLDKVVSAGGHYDVIDLPKRGITGNSHMLMMDKNNLAVADEILAWLRRKGFWQ